AGLAAAASLHRRRLAAEPHARARRPLHRHALAALGSESRRGGRPRHHGRLLRPCLRRGTRRGRPARHVGNGVRGTEVAGSCLPAVGGLPLVGQQGARRRAGPASHRALRTAGHPGGGVPGRLLDQRAQPQGRNLLSGLRAPVHRAGRARQDPGLPAARRPVQHQQRAGQQRLGRGCRLDGAPPGGAARHALARSRRRCHVHRVRPEAGAVRQSVPL
ncbi:MAG: Lysine exporter protein LysE/YggA, partial [uncultured Ramlibacter sp.]